ncbi:type IV pilus secretin PilQ [Photobacterium sp. 1_MG-2023]|uniref:type IV pilus secretin PilQ n=1 Tax=Photobacterium sp. 1_MG-2023 TaxID=3062646 RepID=UPI0026E196C4|nr:type IV pilus secretin PilQ [Photobacterium sp. 1_MG-2023]MDO6706227.1 type IV pilus secretin PilQ [Photobacterium sp. 1_MG-2023]
MPIYCILLALIWGGGLMPLSAVAASATADSAHQKRISLNFQDVPVRQLLQVMADYQQTNLIVSDAVQGSITLHLKEVAWAQAMDHILRLKGLAYVRQENVMLVATPDELAHYAMETPEHRLTDSNSSALNTRVIPIRYAKATELADLLAGKAGQPSLLTASGALHVDDRTNALIVKDQVENLESLQGIITALDQPVRQVQIEARIVSMNERDMSDLGVRWAMSEIQGDLTIGGSIEANLATLNPEAGSPELHELLNVNLGAQAGAARIAFQVAKLGDQLLDLELSALQAEDKAEIISSPRLVTTNKKMAYIEQGTEIPYLEAASSGATSVSFKKAVLSLMVTPQITPDDKLVLDLEVTQNKPGESVNTGTGEAVAIDTQRIGTQVLVENGETIVLGGIFQHQFSQSVRKVPLLGDLPLIGTLFRQTMERDARRELLIFVTPKILR